jgi:hypothetical protein
MAARGHARVMLIVAMVASGLLGFLWHRRLRVLRAVAALLARAGDVAKLPRFVEPPADENAAESCELAQTEAMLS